MPTGSFSELSLRDFLDQLASDAPTPGGGSVAALTGALAAGLGQMACALTVGKPKFAAVEEKVRAAAERLARAEGMFRRLIDEDAAAYLELSSAFKLKKDDPQRGERIRQAATLAAEIPLETAALASRTCHEIMALMKIANPNLKADLEAAGHLAQAAAHAAGANVRANLPLLDAEAAREIEKQLDGVIGS